MLGLDYYDAYKRHWKDAELLLKEERWANADHHYGLAAECGLKRLMVESGMKLLDERPVDEKDRKHADEIWTRYDAYREGRLSYQLPEKNPFFDWKIDQRYDHRRDFDKSRAHRHREGAKIVRKLIERAQREVSL